MKIKFKLHQDDRRLVFVFFAVWVLILTLTALMYIFGPPYLPLWYSLTVPQEQLASKAFVWIFPGLSTLIMLIGLWSGRRTDLEHERYLARLSLICGLVLMFLLLLAQLRILKIVL